MSPRSGRQVSKEIPHFALSHASRARLFASSIRGSASLHPRLYASTRYAGLEVKTLDRFHGAKYEKADLNIYP
jgi:hypothetical protein